MSLPEVVSREQWLEARLRLLAEEKEMTRRRDALNAERRRLPMVRIDKEYLFEGGQGPVALAGLFGDSSQLIVHHVMFAPIGMRHARPARTSSTNFRTRYSRGCAPAQRPLPWSPGRRWPKSRRTGPVRAGRCPGIPLTAATSTTTSRPPWTRTGRSLNTTTVASRRSSPGTRPRWRCQESVASCVRAPRFTTPTRPGRAAPMSWAVNGHGEIRLGGLVFSGLAATSFPGWWPRVLPAGRGLGGQRDHPLAGEGLGEPVGVALC